MLHDIVEYTAILLHMRPHSIVYFGTYETRYPRNALMIRKLIAEGHKVSICSVPLLDAFEHKTHIFKHPLLLAKLAFNAVYCYAKLIGLLILKHRKSQSIYVGYIGQLDMLVVWPLAKLLRKKLYFNALISLYDTMVLDRQRFKPHSIIGRMLWLVDYLAFHAADTVIMDTEAHKQYISEEFHVNADSIEAVPVDAEPQFRRLHVQKSPEYAERFVVLFYGKFIPLQGVDTILRAMHLLQEKGENHIVLRMVGNGQLHDDMRALSNELQLQNVDWIDWIAYEELPVEINKADLCLGIFGTSDKAARVVPNKVWQCLRCGKKVITRRMSIPEKHPLFNNVISVDHTPEALADAIVKESLIAHPHTTTSVLHSAL